MYPFAIEVIKKEEATTKMMKLQMYKTRATQTLRKWKTVGREKGECKLSLIKLMRKDEFLELIKRQTELNTYGICIQA